MYMAKTEEDKELSKAYKDLRIWACSLGHQTVKISGYELGLKNRAIGFFKGLSLGIILGVAIVLWAFTIFNFLLT
jgi:hypothetical protein